MRCAENRTQGSSGSRSNGSGSATHNRPFSHAELSGLEMVQNLTRVQHGDFYTGMTWD